MLAQSFKTATDLGISQGAVDALHQVLILLETEKLTHLLEDDFGDFDFLEDKVGLYKYTKRGDAPTIFNMSTWHSSQRCGTVACIGGAASLISGIDFNRLVHGVHPMNMEPKIHNLYALFYPDVDGGYDELTVQQAAQALRNYLTTGKSDWAKVVGQDGI